MPTEENIREKVIYFVPKVESKQGDVYDEFIRINNSWEHIGTTQVDLNDYYSKEEVDKKNKVFIETFLLRKGTEIENGYAIFTSNFFIVGNNSIEVYLDGVKLKKAEDYEDGNYKEMRNNRGT